MSSEPDEPRYRFAVAPRFTLPDAWHHRLACNGGVETDGDAGRLRPRDDWRPVGVEALPALIARVLERDAALPATHLGLVQLPERLRKAWWARAERSGTLPVTDAGLEKVYAEIVEFFRFKRLPLPERVSFEVAMSVPGLPSTRVGRAGELAGLGFGDRPPTADRPGRLPLGLVNLGDEATFVVLLDLPPAALVARLVATGMANVQALPPPALVERYLAAFPGQPFLRVRLAPGEGLWLSPFGVVHDGWTRGKRDLDVLLSVGGESSSAAAPSLPSS